MKKLLFDISLVVCAMAAIIFVKFRKIIFNLNDVIFSNSIDPIKSYYNFSYILKYGGSDGLVHRGINYPYGDHLHMVNSHPLYVYIARLISPVIDVSEYGVGIINGTMLFSMILGAVAIYLVLSELKMKRWYSILLAIIIQLLYPQFDRINGHFEMVFAPAIPFFFYLLLRFYRAQHKNPWIVFMILWSITCGFIGAYLVAFCSIFVLSLLLVELVVHRQDLRAYRRHGLQLLLIAAIPLIFMKSFTDITDFVSDRPSNPYGFFEYNANPLSIYLPSTSILRSILLPRMYDYSWEGRAYVGLPATIMTLSLLLYVFYHFIRARKFVIDPFNRNKQLWYYLLASFIVLLFSMSWPFDWGLQWVPDKITILKQFRALGRFSWVFYYILSFYTAYMLWYFYEEAKARNMHFAGVALLVFALSHWAFDGVLNLKHTNYKKIKENTYLSEKQRDVYHDRLATNGFDTETFQGIISIPFAQTNGDKMLFHKGEWFWREALAMSLHTGIPVIQSYSPRLSFSQAHTSIQLLSDPCIQKERLADMDDRPILLITDKSKLRAAEKRFADKGKLFFEKGNLQYFLLDVATLKNEYAACEKRYMEMNDAVGSSLAATASDSSGHFYYESFDDLINDAPATHSGPGAFFIRDGEENILSINLSDKHFHGAVEISFWMYFDKRKSDMPAGFIDIFDGNGKLVESKFTYSRESHNVQNNWVKNSVTTTVSPGYTYKVRLTGEYVTIDDLLLRELTTDVLVRQPNCNLFNNFKFKK